MPESWVDIVVQAIIVTTGILGQLFIIKKNAIGFWFWIVSNITMISASIYTGYYGLVLLHIFYSAMCIYGLREWKRTNTKQNHANLKK